MLCGLGSCSLPCNSEVHQTMPRAHHSGMFKVTIPKNVQLILDAPLAMQSSLSGFASGTLMGLIHRTGFSEGFLEWFYKALYGI